MNRPPIATSRRMYRELTRLRTEMHDVTDDRLHELDVAISTLGWTVEGHTPLQLLNLQRWAQLTVKQGRKADNV